MRKLLIIIVMMLVLVVADTSFAIKFTVEPVTLSVNEGEIVELSIYLDDWYEANNVAGVDYYITYDNDAASIVSVTPAAAWDDTYFYDATPVPGSGSCGVVNYGSGVAGPKMLLQTVVLVCIDGDVDFNFVVNLGADGVVLDVLGGEYTNVTAATVPIDQIPPPACDCSIHGPATIEGDPINVITQQYFGELGGTCFYPPDYDWVILCGGTIPGITIDDTGLVTVPATTVGEHCTITLTDTANTDMYTGEPVVCMTGVRILDGSTDDTNFCKGNFDYDKDVDGTDASTFKQDFGRSAFSNPCPKDGPSPVSKTWQLTAYQTYDNGWFNNGLAWPNPRFTDNGNGSVTDNLSGLIWLKNAYCADVQAGNWYDALANAYFLHGQTNVCGLTDGSYSGDWRLPNVKELQSLIDFNYYGPALPSGHPFTNVQSLDYWTSTTDAYDSQRAWLVFMANGYLNLYNKASAAYVWPVRGGH